MTLARCERDRAELIDLVAGGVGAGRARALRRHISSCDDCRSEVEQLEATWELLGEWRIDDVPEPADSSDRILHAARPRYAKFAVELAMFAAAMWLVFLFIPAQLFRTELDEQAHKLQSSGPVLVQAGKMRTLSGTESLRVGLDRRADIRLPDGTNVVAAPGSRLVLRFTGEGLRLAMDLTEGEVEVEATPGLPVRVNVPGGSVATLGTRFNVRVARPSSPFAAAVSSIIVHHGTVSVEEEALGVHTDLGQGRTRVVVSYLDRGELTGRLASRPADRKHFLLGSIHVWKIGVPGLGDVEVCSAIGQPALPSGKWLRLAFARREGMAFVTSFNAVEMAPAPVHCGPRVSEAYKKHEACLGLYRTLAASEDSQGLLDAAAALVQMKDVLGRSRILLASNRISGRSPDAAEDLRRCADRIPRVTIIDAGEVDSPLLRREP